MEPVSGELADRINLTAAIEAELDQPQGMLPSRVIESVAREHIADLAGRLANEFVVERRLAQGELVWASKARLHARPILSLAFTDRCMYRALVNDVAPEAWRPDKLREASEAYKTAVLLPGVQWVAEADVASYYEYVDHETLCEEIIRVTAKADTAVRIRQLLHEVSGREFGIPQNLGSSRMLGEFYIRPAELDLLQRGFTVSRYNDDFRIGTKSAPEAFKAVEQLQYVLRERGLGLNEGKSRVSERRTYIRYLTRLRELLTSALQQVDVDPALINLNPYEHPDIPPHLAASALQLYGKAFDALRERPVDPFDRVFYRQLLDIAIGLLRLAEAPTALADGPMLMIMDPSLAITFSRYLRELTTSEPGAVVKCVNKIGSSLSAYAPAWQSAWVLSALITPEVRPPKGLLDWARGLWESTAPYLLRARGATVLAVHGALKADEVAAILPYVPRVAEPDMVVAMSLALKGSEPGRSVKAALDKEWLYGWTHEYAGQHSQDLSWV